MSKIIQRTSFPEMKLLGSGRKCGEAASVTILISLSRKFVAKMNLFRGIPKAFDANLIKLRGIKIYKQLK